MKLEKRINEVFKRRYLRVVSYISFFLFPLCCWLIMEIMNRSALYFDSEERTFCLLSDWMDEFPLKVLFGLIVLYTVFICLYLLFKKAWITAAVLGAFSFVFSFVNDLKLMMQGDPFLPMDITLIGQSGDLISFLNMSPPWFFFVLLVVALLWIAFLYLSKPDCPGKYTCAIPFC